MKGELNRTNNLGSTESVVTLQRSGEGSQDGVALSRLGIDIKLFGTIFHRRSDLFVMVCYVVVIGDIVMKCDLLMNKLIIFHISLTF